MKHDKLTAIIYGVAAVFCIYNAFGKFTGGRTIMGITYAALGVMFLVLEALYYRKYRNPELDPELDGKRYDNLKKESGAAPADDQIPGGESDTNPEKLKPEESGSEESEK